MQRYNKKPTHIPDGTASSSSVSSSVGRGATTGSFKYKAASLKLIALIIVLWYYLAASTGGNKQNAIDNITFPDVDIQEHQGDVDMDHTTTHTATTKTAAALSMTNASNNAKINDLLCNAVSDKQEEWRRLCSGNFIIKASQLLLAGDDLNIVQIGAHVGFEKNDPIAKGLFRLLDEVEAAATVSAGLLNLYRDKNEIRKRFHWTFVEPSPPNFKRLLENLMKHSALCDMHGINSAVAPDSMKKSSKMPFYSMRDTIDPETGYDSLSGKTLPFWVTQVSSFHKETLLFADKYFKRRGLDLKDYIVETTVVTKPYSALMQEALGDKKNGPLLVLIDTEGFDCDIINGISPTSPYLPAFLLFESKSCHLGSSGLINTNNHLKSLGYDIYQTGPDNTIAIKKEAT